MDSIYWAPSLSTKTTTENKNVIFRKRKKKNMRKVVGFLKKEKSGVAWKLRLSGPKSVCCLTHTGDLPLLSCAVNKKRKIIVAYNKCATNVVL